MSLSWRNELTLTLGAGGVASLPPIPRGARVTAILSSHHARYALLPWSEALSGEKEWQALARYRFAETYGPQAGDWEIRVSPSPRGAARMACGIERGVLAALRDLVSGAGASLVSVQPGLMHAFNARRREFRRAPGWLVAAEEGRLALALIVRGLWELVRVRNVGPAWRSELEAILRREEDLARRETPVERILLA
ncbi:MAG: hypothetical protein OEV81_13415 [Betaproteobacteria bacterium]|nr:hypothetical protein [Betaproteobacteria bacterium]MDH5222737.1 hypothetical protein [Betaproteobacteria bacterium]MDH5352589.1 hypothetical protein [Betaproteobacteria bacterium]